MYKKDDYIVCLPEPNKCPVDTDSDGGAGFLANYCYKVTNTSDYGVHQILWGGNRKESGIYNNSVRYADEEEIEEYERLGKPFDVTTFTPFKLPDNWHILVTDENAEDVLTWRFERIYNDKDKITFKNHFVGMTLNHEGTQYEKGHNPKDEVKDSEGHYDFGIEITYEQFKKYVLNQDINKEDYTYLIKLFKKLKIK